MSETQEQPQAAGGNEFGDDDLDVIQEEISATYEGQISAKRLQLDAPFFSAPLGPAPAVLQGNEVLKRFQHAVRTYNFGNIIDGAAGVEFFVVDGDALVLAMTKRAFLDWNRHGGAFLHVVFLVERYLQRLIAQGMHFSIVFFEYNALDTPSAERLVHPALWYEHQQLGTSYGTLALIREVVRAHLNSRSNIEVHTLYGGWFDHIVTEDQDIASTIDMFVDLTMLAERAGRRGVSLTGKVSSWMDYLQRTLPAFVVTDFGSVENSPERHRNAVVELFAIDCRIMKGLPIAHDLEPEGMGVRGFVSDPKRVLPPGLTPGTRQGLAFFVSQQLAALGANLPLQCDAAVNSVDASLQVDQEAPHRSFVSLSTVHHSKESLISLLEQAHREFAAAMKSDKEYRKLAPSVRASAIAGAVVVAIANGGAGSNALSAGDASALAQLLLATQIAQSSLSLKDRNFGMTDSAECLPTPIVTQFVDPFCRIVHSLISCVTSNALEDDEAWTDLIDGRLFHVACCTFSRQSSFGASALIEAESLGLTDGLATTFQLAVELFSRVLGALGIPTVATVDSSTSLILSTCQDIAFNEGPGSRALAAPALALRDWIASDVFDNFECMPKAPFAKETPAVPLPGWHPEVLLQEKNIVPAPPTGFFARLREKNKAKKLSQYVLAVQETVGKPKTVEARLGTEGEDDKAKLSSRKTLLLKATKLVEDAKGLQAVRAAARSLREHLFEDQRKAAGLGSSKSKTSTKVSKFAAAPKKKGKTTAETTLSESDIEKIRSAVPKDSLSAVVSSLKHVLATGKSYEHCLMRGKDEEAYGVAMLLHEHYNVARQYQKYKQWDQNEVQDFINSCDDVVTVAVALLAARAADMTRDFLSGKGGTLFDSFDAVRSAADVIRMLWFDDLYERAVAVDVKKSKKAGVAAKGGKGGKKKPGAGGASGKLGNAPAEDGHGKLLREVVDARRAISAVLIDCLHALELHDDERWLNSLFDSSGKQCKKPAKLSTKRMLVENFTRADNPFVGRLQPPRDTTQFTVHGIETSFWPEPWQQQLMARINRDESVLVSAPTSAGKTFLSFYLFEKVLRETKDGVVVFVMPTKALVNQVYADLSARFTNAAKNIAGIFTGEDKVDVLTCRGLVTVPYNLERLLLSNDKAAAKWRPKLRYVVLDEIHCMAQFGMGTSWENIMLMIDCPFVGLSATLGNTDSLLSWLDASSTRKTELVSHSQRLQPLQYWVPHIQLSEDAPPGSDTAGPKTESGLTIDAKAKVESAKAKVEPAKADSSESDDMFERPESAAKSDSDSDDLFDRDGDAAGSDSDDLFERSVTEPKSKGVSFAPDVKDENTSAEEADDEEAMMGAFNQQTVEKMAPKRASVDIDEESDSDEDEENEELETGTGPKYHSKMVDIVAHHSVAALNRNYLSVREAEVMPPMSPGQALELVDAAKDEAAQRFDEVKAKFSTFVSSDGDARATHELATRQLSWLDGTADFMWNGDDEERKAAVELYVRRIGTVKDVDVVKQHSHFHTAWSVERKAEELSPGAQFPPARVPGSLTVVDAAIAPPAASSEAALMIDLWVWQKPLSEAQHTLETVQANFSAFVSFCLDRVAEHGPRAIEILFPLSEFLKCIRCASLTPIDDAAHQVLVAALNEAVQQKHGELDAHGVERVIIREMVEGTDLLQRCSPDAFFEDKTLNRMDILAYSLNAQRRVVDLVAAAEHDRSFTARLQAFFGRFRQPIDHIYRDMDAIAAEAGDAYDLSFELRHIGQLVGQLKEKDWLPSIMFSFDKLHCEALLTQIVEYVGDDRKKLFANDASFERAKGKIQMSIDAIEREHPDFGQIYKLGLRRGVAVHHEASPLEYQKEVETLFRGGHLRIVIATATLALGIHMPCRTVVICGKSIYMTPVFFQQCSGRSGRRGYDAIGNVILFNMPQWSMARLLTAEPPSVRGALGPSPSFALRLAIWAEQSRQEKGGAERVVDVFNRANARPLFGFDSFGREQPHPEQAPVHMRHTFDFLRRLHLIDAEANSDGLAAFARNFHDRHPINFLFSFLFENRTFHDFIKAQREAGANDGSVREQILIVLIRLLSRGRQSPIADLSTFQSVPPVPQEFADASARYEQIVLDVYRASILNYCRCYPDRANDCRLPLTSVQYPLFDNANELNLPAGSLLGQVCARSRRNAADAVSPFAGLSGNTDNFGSIDEMVSTINHQVVFDKSLMPWASLRSNDPVNRFVLDFAGHGVVKKAHQENNLYLLSETDKGLSGFERSLRDIKFALQAMIDEDKRTAEHEDRMDMFWWALSHIQEAFHARYFKAAKRRRPNLRKLRQERTDADRHGSARSGQSKRDTEWSNKSSRDSQREDAGE